MAEHSGQGANEGQIELKVRAGELAKDAAGQLLERANETGARGLQSVARGIDTAAEFVEERGKRLADGKLPVKASQVEAVAGSLHDAAGYLKEHDPKSIVRDLDGAVHRHPYRALAVGVAVGWVIGKLMSRD